MIYHKGRWLIEPEIKALLSKLEAENEELKQENTVVLRETDRLIKEKGQLVGNAERGCEYRKDIELKPCPFCGSKSVWVADNILDYLFIGYNVHCNGCGVETSYTKDRDKAIERWNRRTENEQINA